MNTIALTLKEPPTVPLEAEVLSPDTLAPLRHNEIGALPIFLGKRQLRLEDFFTVEGEGSDELEIRGDLGRVKWIGRGMTRGKITVLGNAGMHLGAHMKGGTIEVRGNAADWIGAEMTGGLIHIHGDAGGQIGAAYRGSLSGMNGGVILVEGSAGMEIGMRMRRGILAVKGPSARLRRLADEGGHHFSARRCRNSHRRVDDSRHHRLLDADRAVAYLLVCLHLQADISAFVYPASGGAGLLDSLPGWRRRF